MDINNIINIKEMITRIIKIFTLIVKTIKNMKQIII